MAIYLSIRRMRPIHSSIISQGFQGPADAASRVKQLVVRDQSIDLRLRPRGVQPKQCTVHAVVRATAMVTLRSTLKHCWFVPHSWSGPLSKTRGLEEHGTELRRRSTGEVVGWLEFFITSQPFLRIRCRRHAKCLLVMNTRTSFFEKCARGVAWLVEGACVSEQDHFESTKHVRESFGIRVKGRPRPSVPGAPGEEGAAASL